MDVDLDEVYRAFARWEQFLFEVDQHQWEEMPDDDDDRIYYLDDHVLDAEFVGN